LASGTSPALKNMATPTALIFIGPALELRQLKRAPFRSSDCCQPADQKDKRNAKAHLGNPPHLVVKRNWNSRTRKLLPPCAITSKAILKPVAAGASSSKSDRGFAKKPHLERSDICAGSGGP
jgi:hypothetical protein